MPSIEYLSFEKLKLKPHVAGATILAAGSSMTELFTSLAGVFLAKNDISINILLGSGSYNMLIIVGISSFFVFQIKDHKLKKYPIFRDCFFYFINLLLIFLFLFKNNYDKLYWYDSLIGLIFYVIFMIVNIFDEKIVNLLFQKPSVLNNIDLTEKCNLDQTIAHQSNETISSGSSKSSGGYEEPYNFMGPLKKFKTYSLMKKMLIIVTLPARLIGFV